MLEKSSLINALTNRKGLARASNTPGRTQEINFFELGEARYLVDLPGYGYANAPLAVVEKWQRLLKKLPFWPPKFAPRLCIDRQPPRNKTGG